MNHLWFHEKWCATKLFRFNFWNVWLIILTTWNFKMQAKLQFLRPPNSYILHCHSKSGLFTIYLKGNGMKNSKFGKSWILYMYTLGPQCKIFNYHLHEGHKWLGINETKWATFDFMRNDVLQNYLINFWNVWLIILTTWNFKIQQRLQFLRPPNNILHCHRCQMTEKFQIWKIWILYMYFGTTMQNF